MREWVVSLMVAVALLAWLAWRARGLIPPWRRAREAGLDVGLPYVVDMRIRKVDPEPVLEAAARALEAGVEVELFALEAHYLVGGDVVGVIDRLVRAHREGRDLSFNEAAARDLAEGT